MRVHTAFLHSAYNKIKLCFVCFVFRVRLDTKQPNVRRVPDHEAPEVSPRLGVAVSPLSPLSAVVVRWMRYLSPIHEVRT